MRWTQDHGMIFGALLALALFAPGCSAAPTPRPPAPAGLVTVAPSRPPAGAADAVASPASPAPPPTRDTSASPRGAADDRFKTATASDSAYQVEAPGPMTEEVQTLTAGGQMHHMHTNKKGDVIYDVAWVKLDPRVAGLPSSQLLEATARSMTQSAPGVKASPRTLKGSPQLDALVVEQPGPNGVTLRHCILIGQGRLYQLTVTPLPGKRAEAADADRFFDSFTLLAAPSPSRP